MCAYKLVEPGELAYDRNLMQMSSALVDWKSKLGFLFSCRCISYFGTKIDLFDVFRSVKYRGWQKCEEPCLSMQSCTVYILGQ